MEYPIATEYRCPTNNDRYIDGSMHQIDESNTLNQGKKLNKVVPFLSFASGERWIEIPPVESNTLNMCMER